MMDDTDPTLASACAAVRLDSNPAFVKDSELRYHAVNAAYAALWDCSPADLVGFKSHQHFDALEQNDRDEKERRTLVFGKDQVALFAHPLKEGRYRIRIRRERQASGKPFIVGHFETIAKLRFESTPGEQVRPFAASARMFEQAVSPPLVIQPDIKLRGNNLILKAAIEAAADPVAVLDGEGRVLACSPGYHSAFGPWQETPLPEGGLLRRARPASGRSQPTLDHDGLNARLREIFDCIDVGVVLYDPHDMLVYINPTMQGMTDGAYRLQPGMTLRTVLETACPVPAGTDEAAREAWIGRFTEAQHKFGTPSLARIGNGRWLKLINRRLADGSILGLRVDMTEQKNRELALEDQSSENSLFRAILDELPITTFIKDEAFAYVFANRAHEQLTGLAHETVIGKEDFALFGAEVGRALRDADLAVMESDSVSQVEVSLSSSRGEVLMLLDRKTAFTAPNGQRFLLGSSFDVTLQKQSEQEIFEARQLAERSRSDLESTLDSVQMGVVVVDRDLNIEIINNAFFRIWKVRPEDGVIGAPFRTLIDVNRDNGVYAIPDDEFDAYVDQRLAEIAKGYVEPREFNRADGRTVIYSVRALSNGKRMVSYFDITELKQREAELEAAQRGLERASALLHDAAGAMAQGLLVLRRGEVRFFNQAFIDLLDVPATLVRVGGDWQAFLDHCAARGDYGEGLEAEETCAGIRDWHQRGVAHTIERRSTCDRWLRIDAKPASNDIMILTYTDVTEASKREALLKDLLGKAEIADRAKSEFLANMSHEIRTPMNGVLGMAELLSRTDLDTRQRTFTDIIVKSGNGLLTIINDILDFSKIDAGQMTLDQSSFDIGETIEDVATLVSTRAAEKDIELIVRIDPALPARVIGDMGRIRQVVTNLAGNAVKFTERGHVLIELSGNPGREGGVALTLRVTDTGIGIPGEKLQSVFEKFSQVDASSTRRHEGTGLGLAITSRLVDLMGGTIRAESRIGEGSVFTVSLTLPVDKVEVAARRTPIDVSGARVLVIDDNPVNRAILIEQLATWGFDACAAVSGEEGEEVLAQAARLGVAVDAVILDYHMPDRDGVMVARSIRRTWPATDLPILMLTSMDVKAAEPGFCDISVQATLMKPARSSLLLETLASLLQEARHRPDAAHPSHDAPPPGEPIMFQTASLPAAALVARAAFGLDVLVAEDNPVNQIVFTQILEDLGVSYQIAGDGFEAFGIWKEVRPAIVLMDVSMPVMNGHQATAAIRDAEVGDPGRGRTPVIGVTAHALAGDRERCMEAGMDDYLSKPISPEKLEAKIRQWLPAEIAARLSAQ